jgi:hypothetical protein
VERKEGTMELPAKFPNRTLFLCVQRRVPVTIRHGSDWIVARWDSPTPPSPRPFSPRIAIEQGKLISEDEFRRLVVTSRAAAVAFQQRSLELVEAMVQNLRVRTRIEERAYTDLMARAMRK